MEIAKFITFLVLAVLVDWATNLVTVFNDIDMTQLGLQQVNGGYAEHAALQTTYTNRSYNPTLAYFLRFACLTALIYWLYPNQCYWLGHQIRNGFNKIVK